MPQTTAIHVKKDWRAYVPGFPPGEQLNTRYCRVCERWLEDNPNAGIKTNKDHGAAVVDTWREVSDNPYSHANPEAAPTCGDALERLLVQGELGAGTDVWEHLFVPGAELHRHALNHPPLDVDLSTWMEKVQNRIKVAVRR